MQTARHFQRHLEQFLEQNAIVGCEVGTKSEHPGHFAAFCCAPEAVQNALIQALRPQRAL